MHARSTAFQAVNFRSQAGNLCYESLLRGPRPLQDLTRLQQERLKHWHIHGLHARLLFHRKAGVRKMIARLHEELAVYEGSEEARQPQAK